MLISALYPVVWWKELPPGHESQLCTFILDSIISDITWYLEVVYGGSISMKMNKWFKLGFCLFVFKSRLLTIYQHTTANISHEGVVRLKWKEMWSALMRQRSASQYSPGVILFFSSLSTHLLSFLNNNPAGICLYRSSVSYY